jgi:hypothetical protein
MRKLLLIFTAFITILICYLLIFPTGVHAETIDYEQLLTTSWKDSGNFSNTNIHFNNLNPSDVVISVNNTSGHSLGVLFNLFGTSSNCNIINTGISSFLIDWTPTTGGSNFNVAYSSDDITCNSGTSYSFQYLGIDQTCNYSSDNGCDQSSNFLPYFKVGTNLDIGNLSFLDPINNQKIPNGSYLFSGTCPTNGVARIAIFSSVIPTAIDEFTIDCINHLWATYVTITDGQKYYYLNDKNCLDTNRLIPGTIGQYYGCGQDPDIYWSSVFITGFDSSIYGNWLFNLDYPECTLIQGSQSSYDCNNLKEGNWQFRFRYKFPIDTPTNAIGFEIYECDYNYQNCNLMDNDLISNLDPNNYGRIDLSAGYLTVENDTSHYYIAKLIYDGDPYSTITIKTLGNDQGLPVLPPNTTNCGSLQWLCLAIIPDNDKFNNLITEFNTVLSTKSPFGYAYAIVNQINSINGNTNESADTTLNINIAGQQRSMPISITSNTVVQGFAGGFRPIMIWTIWILFGLYIINRVFPPK